MKKHNSKPGRRKTKWLVPTMAAASGATGLPMDAIKEAKRAGCTAFPANGNVDCTLLLKFLAEHPEILERAGASVNMAVEEALTKRAERIVAEHRANVAIGEFLPLKDMKQDGTRFVMELKRKAFALPRRLAHVFALETDAINIEQKLNEELTEVFSDISKKPWTSMTCPKCKTEIQS